MPLAKRFLQKLEGLGKSPARTDVKRAIGQIVRDGSPTDGTKLVRYSQVKSYLKKNLPDFVSLVAVPVDLIDGVAADRAMKLKDRENIVVEKDWLDTIEGWRSSESIPELAAYLQLMSGRRISEIHSAEFKAYGARIGSTELRKKRGNTSLCIFPLHPSTKAKDWLHLLEKFRSKQNVSVNTLTTSVNRRLKKLDSILTSHKLRGVYANLMWRLSGRKQVQTGFIQDILCLESHDVAIHYSAYIVPSF